MRRPFAAEPWIRPSDLRLWGDPRWEEIDEVASAWLGRRCLALPSVRVGLCWALQHSGYARHRDHIFVPRYMGRCILNSLSRFVFPVEVPTTETRIALVVDQFGLRQDLGALRPEFERRGWKYIEDSPYAIGDDETPGAGSFGRFIGLGKVLPVVQGALFVSGDKSLHDYVCSRRKERSAWSWLVWLVMLAVRPRYVGGYSEAADAVYELYVAARGGNSWLRGNLMKVLARADQFEHESQSRFASLRSALADRVLLPDQNRMGYLVPFFTRNDLEEARSIFRRHGYDDAQLHVDVDRNMLAPRYKKALVIPVNARVSRSAFDALVSDLHCLVARGSEPD